jgi:hypothetical protein
MKSSREEDPVRASCAVEDMQRKVGSLGGDGAGSCGEQGGRAAAATRRLLPLPGLRQARSLLGSSKLRAVC